MIKKEYQERLTNQQVIVRLMNHSQHGALMYAFMFTAMESYAKQVLFDEDQTRAVMANGMVEADAWIGCAKELVETLDGHLNSIFPKEAMQ